MTKTDPAGPAAGWLEGKSHFLPIRVYYEDTDLSGLVYHASYLRFMERGRSEFLRLSGTAHKSMLEGDDPLMWTLRRIAVDYLKPARVEDALLVRTEVREVTGARMKLTQTVLRGGEDLVRGQVEACVIDRDGKPRRIPDEIRSRLDAFCAS